MTQGSCEGHVQGHNPLDLALLPKQHSGAPQPRCSPHSHSGRPSALADKCCLLRYSAEGASGLTGACRRTPPGPSPRAALHPHLCPAAARCKQHDTESKRLKNNMGLLLRQDVLSLEAPGGSAPQGHRQRPSLSQSAPPASAPWPSSSSPLAPGVGKWLLQRQVLLPSAARLESGRTHTPRAPPVSNETFPEAPADAPRTSLARPRSRAPHPPMPERWDHWTCAHRGPVTKEEG